MQTLAVLPAPTNSVICLSVCLSSKSAFKYIFNRALRWPHCVTELHMHNVFAFFSIDEWWFFKRLYIWMYIAVMEVLWRYWLQYLYKYITCKFTSCILTKFSEGCRIEQWCSKTMEQGWASTNDIEQIQDLAEFIQASDFCSGQISLAILLKRLIRYSSKWYTFLKSP